MTPCRSPKNQNLPQVPWHRLSEHRGGHRRKTGLPRAGRSGLRQYVAGRVCGCGRNDHRRPQCYPGTVCEKSLKFRNPCRPDGAESALQSSHTRDTRKARSNVRYLSYRFSMVHHRPIECSVYKIIRIPRVSSRENYPLARGDCHDFLPDSTHV